MKQKTSTIISIISTVGLILCVLYISDLKSDIENLNASTRNQYNTLNNEVKTIYSNVDEMLKKQASLLAGKTIEYGEKDLESKTVELICTAVPKEYKPGKTTAVLICDGKEYQMKYKDGSFTAKIPLSIFDDHVVNSIVFETDGLRQTEDISEQRTPRWDVMPMVYASLSGQTTRSSGSYRIDSDGNITMDSKSDTSRIEKVYLVEYRDGKEISREEILKDHDDNRTTFNFTVKKAYALPEGSVFALCTEVIDENGFIYRNLVEKVKATSNNFLDYSDALWRSAEANIYAPDGEPLYEAEWTL